MSSALKIGIDLGGGSEAASAVQEMRNALSSRRGLHTHMAERVKRVTQKYLRQLNRHGSAERLGAKPTGHDAKAAAAVEAQSDEDAARVLIPRRTGLGRAFADVIIKPGSGKTYLTIPAHQLTYGRPVRSFPKGAFRFSVLHSWRTFACLMWVEDGSGHRAGEVAYWLRKEVSQKKDRTLLPSDELYAKEARYAALEYLSEQGGGGDGSGGPRGLDDIIGGRSSAMPSAV